MKCIKCEHKMLFGVCDIDTCKCICTTKELEKEQQWH